MSRQGHRFKTLLNQAVPDKDTIIPGNTMITGKVLQSQLYMMKGDEAHSDDQAKIYFGTLLNDTRTRLNELQTSGSDVFTLGRAKMLIAIRH